MSLSKEARWSTLQRWSVMGLLVAIRQWCQYRNHAVELRNSLNSSIRFLKNETFKSEDALRNGAKPHHIWHKCSIKISPNNSRWREANQKYFGNIWPTNKQKVLVLPCFVKRKLRKTPWWSTAKWKAETFSTRTKKMKGQHVMKKSISKSSTCSQEIGDIQWNQRSRRTRPMAMPHMVNQNAENRKHSKCHQ